MPREFHGLGSLIGYGPQGHKKSDTTERLTSTSNINCLSADKISKKEKKEGNFGKREMEVEKGTKKIEGTFFSSV